MFGGGRNMGGGVGGSGGMLRTVGRAVMRAGVTNLQEPISSSSSNSTSPARNSRSSTNNNKKKISSSSAGSISLSAVNPLNNNNIPVSGIPRWPSFGSLGDSYCDEYEWISAAGSEDERSRGYIGDDFILGPVPSIDEVNTAVSALQQVFDPTSYSQLVRDKYFSSSWGHNNVADHVSGPSGWVHRVPSTGSESDWMEPSFHSSDPRMLQPYGADRVYDAFHLLRTEPSIQRMVISLSSDKAVWDAVLNNEAVRELKESLSADFGGTSLSDASDEAQDDSNPAMNIIQWIFNNTKAKVMEVIEKITSIANELFNPPVDVETTGAAASTSRPTDSFEEKLRTSFLISIVVLLVVVVSRASRA